MILNKTAVRIIITCIPNHLCPFMLIFTKCSFLPLAAVTGMSPLSPYLNVDPKYLIQVRNNYIVK